MCGIVGYIGDQNVVQVLVEGLRRLEYRGYDSAGIAVVDNGKLQLLRSEGKLDNLARQIDPKQLQGSYGLGHTRWATHGRPNEENAHPHRDCTGTIVVVHTGIIGLTRLPEPATAALLFAEMACVGLQRRRRRPA